MPHNAFMYGDYGQARCTKCGGIVIVGVMHECPTAVERGFGTGVGYYDGTYSVPQLTGWVCPLCGASVSPFRPTCPKCSPESCAR